MEFDSAIELSRAIKSKKISVRESLTPYLERIRANEDKLNSFITVLDEDELFKRADELQSKIDAGEELSPFAGVPCAIKDNISTKGIRTTCASKMLENYTPAFSADAVIKLEKAGALVVGKTNMDEFAMGSTSESSYFGAVKNPWDISKVPGGSSGGSCSAVASGEVMFALGSDTGGSIRQPSGFCGVVGIKPTYGTVSRYGLVAYASSLDQIGPIAGCVTDAVGVLQLIAGHDSKDSTSVKRKDYDFMSYLTEDIKGLKVGIPEQYFDTGLDSEIADAINAAASHLASLGAEVEKFSLSYVDCAVPTYYLIADAEASSNLERFDGVKYGFRASSYEGLHDMYKQSRSQGFGAEVKRRIMLGSFVLSSGYYDAYYLKALKVKALIKQSFDQAFEKYDVILSPVAPTTAPKIGSMLDDPLKMYLSDIYTVSANLASLAAISIPVGVDSSDMPIGMQIIANRFNEKDMIRAAYAYEQSKKSDYICPMRSKGGAS